MLHNWLTYQKRNPANHKFAVADVTESCDSEDEILNYLALELVAAHESPAMIKAEYEVLAQDAGELNLEILKKYVEEEVLPAADRISTRVGNFGEMLAAKLLIEFENFWLPIYKLQVREKKDWAARLTDLCLIKRDGLPKPFVCYGEVKTKSVGCDLQLGVKGHASLVKDDTLSNPGILRFICAWLYDRQMYEEAKFFSRIRLGKLDYDKRHDLFLVHNKEHWTEEVLDKLECCDLDERLVNFSVKVVLIAKLKEVIDEAYVRAWKAAAEIVNG